MSTHTQNPNHFSELNKTNVSSHNICSCNQPAPILEHSESARNESTLPSQLDVRPNVVYLPVVKWNLKLQANPNFPSGSFCTKVFQLDKKLNSISQRLKASAEEVERLATYTAWYLDEENLADEGILGSGILHFIHIHLRSPSSGNIIHWVDKEKTKFVINDPDEFAKMWGEERCKKIEKKHLLRCLNYQVHLGKLKRDNERKFKYILLDRINRIR